MVTPTNSASADSSDAIDSDITMAIAEQRLPPGTKLREESLARVYSVNRTNIRADLVMLAKDKLIDLIPEKAAFIREAKARDTEKAVELMLHHLHHVESALQFKQQPESNKKDFIKALLER